MLTAEGSFVFVLILWVRSLCSYRANLGGGLAVILYPKGNSVSVLLQALPSLAQVFIFHHPGWVMAESLLELSTDSTYIQMMSWW